MNEMNYSQKRYAENRVELLEKSKTYYHENKARIYANKDFKTYNKNYYQLNKTKIDIKRRENKAKKPPMEKATCECGCVMKDKYLIPRHRLSKKHIKLMADLMKTQKRN